MVEMLLNNIFDLLKHNFHKEKHHCTKNLYEMWNILWVSLQALNNVDV